MTLRSSRGERRSHCHALAPVDARVATAHLAVSHALCSLTSVVVERMDLDRAVREVEARNRALAEDIMVKQGERGSNVPKGCKLASQPRFSGAAAPTRTPCSQKPRRAPPCTSTSCVRTTLLRPGRSSSRWQHGRPLSGTGWTPRSICGSWATGERLWTSRCVAAG